MNNKTLGRYQVEAEDPVQDGRLQQFIFNLPHHKQALKLLTCLHRHTQTNKRPTTLASGHILIICDFPINLQTGNKLKYTK